MAKHKREKQINKSLFTTFILLIAVFIGIGYAVLTEQLTINNTVSYDAMKWSIGFASVEDFGQKYKELVESIAPSLISETKMFPLTATISSDKKTLTISCDYRKSTSKNACLAKAVIENDSTFDAKVETLSLNNLEANFSEEEYEFPLANTSIDWYEEGSIISTPIKTGDILKAGESRFIVIAYVTDELTPETIPTKDVEVTFDLTIDWKQIEE